MTAPASEADDDFLPISGLQHLAFCPRQWALIHLEQAWVENLRTAEGRLLHERADLPGESRRADVRTARGVWLRSERLRLAGRADVVEFQTRSDTRRAAEIRPAGEVAAIPYPVEYKRGKRKPDDCDAVQLCAQALCLEEMLSTPVPRGAIFYGTPRRRLEIDFTPELRARTEELAVAMHRLYRSRETPPATPGPYCRSCSLVDICLPEATAHSNAARWVASQLLSLRQEV
jgi:CRISPR-associated exonuclease Cas4